ncbi:TPA: GNAT family N-acetyltransferase [Vibrio parahaemolyticus]|nr:GNAT family N-acetyltransferase [Vibrio parahaemolyticus]
MDKIAISQLVDSDRSAVFDLLQNEKAMRFLGPRRPLTDAEAEVWFANEQQSETRFAFRTVETNEIVGFCGITLLDDELDFGYFIRQKFWGQGLASLMCKSAIFKLAQTIDLTQVKVFIASDNVGSQKVAQKLGWQLKCAAENEFESGHLYQIRT